MNSPGDLDTQRIEWERFVRTQHAKGMCEYSGLTSPLCLGSICDCFETEENASAMTRGECGCAICVAPLTNGGDA